MTTRTFVSSVAQNNDAEFRAWGSEFSTELDAFLPKTADSGQINWATITKPLVNTVSGYEIRRFNDALQATAPIFIKIEFGAWGSATYPTIWITVGTGSNGSGTLTGSVTQRAQCTQNGAPLSGNYPSLISSSAGFFGLLWKAGALSGNVGIGFFAIARHANSSGVSTADGFCVIWIGTNSTTACTMQCVRTAAPATVFAVSNQFSIVPGQVVSSAVDTDYQAYAVLGINPRVWIVPTLATVCLSDIPERASFQTAMIGSTSRTFISLGASVRPVNAGTGPGSVYAYSLAMLWEP